MKTHFSRNRWLYVTLLALVLIPTLLVRSQRVPPLDPRTLNALGQWIDREAARAYGPPAGDAYRDLLKRYPYLSANPKAASALPIPASGKSLNSPGALNEDPRAKLLYEADYQGSPVLASEIESLASDLDPGVDAYLAAGKLNGGYPSMDALVAAARPQGNVTLDTQVDYLSIQFIARLEDERAKLAMHQDRWDDAWQTLSKGRGLADTEGRNGTFIGLLIQTACRAIMTSGYREALLAPPDAARDRKALDELLAGREREPRLLPIVTAMESRYTLANQIAAGERQDTHALFMLLEGACFEVATNRDRFQNAALRNWAERYYTQVMKTDDFYRTPRLEAYPGSVSWTTIPAMRAFLQRALRREPEALAGTMFPPELRAGLDAWTVALVSGGNIGLASANLNEGNTRARTELANERLIEAAFAARLYYLDHHDWPARVEDLIPALLPADLLDPQAQDQPNSSLGAPTGPFLPLHAGWLTIDNDVRQTLWSKALPLQGLERWGFENEQNPAAVPTPTPIPNHRQAQPGLAFAPPGASVVFPFAVSRIGLTTGTMQWTLVESGGDLPLAAVALAQAFDAHPRLAQAASASYRLSDADPWLPLTDENVRPLMQQLEVERQKGEFKTELDPDDQRANIRRLKSEPKTLRLSADLTAPDRVFAIWSNGPDGKDDGAHISYDPTNGTVSKGDLIVFPEGY